MNDQKEKLRISYFLFNVSCLLKTIARICSLKQSERILDTYKRQEKVKTFPV